MEKTMVMNEMMVGTEDTRKMVKEIARNTKRNHVAIWLEVLNDVRKQWEEAENGSAHRSTR